MKLRVYPVIGICVVIVSACSSNKDATIEADSGTNAEQAPTQQPCEVAGRGEAQLVRIDKFDVTSDTLRIDYRVSNILDREIWVCTSVERLGSDLRRSAETRIVDETLHIRRRGNMDQNVFIQGYGEAGYCRVLPGQSRSDQILLTLPIGNASPVYMAEHPLAGKRPVHLKQVVFELGYFDQNLRALISQSKAKGWVPPNPSSSLPTTDPNAAYLPYLAGNRWGGLQLEQSVQVTVSDVMIPGMLGGVLRR